MDTAQYLNLFQKATDQLDQSAFAQNQLELKVGVWLNSFVLKIQKPAWQNPNRLPFDGGIFFSVWINGNSIAESKIHYNVHALKLRELSRYKIQSREFAQAFRLRFKPFEHDWPNVSTTFGPLTLMEGWVKIDMIEMGALIANLATKFLSVQHIIDDLLDERKK